MADESNSESAAGGSAEQNDQAAQAAPQVSVAPQSGEESASEDAGTADKGVNNAEVEKPEEGKKDETVEGAPDEYKDFSLPEGAQADLEAMTQFKEFAKSENLTQDQAQKYVDLHVQAIDKVLAGQMERWNAQKESWREETLADKELHGVDGKADEAIAIAKDAVVKLGGKELQEELDRLGVSNNPRLVKAFFKAGKAMKDDDFVFGGGSGDTRSPAEKLFPSMRKQ